MESRGLFGPHTSPWATFAVAIILTGGAITVPLRTALIWRILKLFTPLHSITALFSNNLFFFFAFQTIKTKFLVRQADSLQPTKGHSLGRETPAHSLGMALAHICLLYANSEPGLSQPLGFQALKGRVGFDLLLSSLANSRFII